MPATKFQVSSTNRKYAPTSGVPLKTTLAFSNDDLAHALFTTGRAPGDQAAYGSASVYEALHRCSLIPAYVRRDGAGQLMRSRLALELDRSEKGAISYALGQAMAAIFCAQALGVTHLLHVDRYASHYSLTFGSGRSRADMFGPGKNGWVVAEAKGRSNNSDADLVKKLRSQKRTVKSVLGMTPWVALGSVACFPNPKYQSMSVLTWDPDDDENESINIDGTLDRFFVAYYAPILAAIEAGSEAGVDGPEYVTGRFDGVALTLGLRADLYRLLTRRQTPEGDEAREGDLARMALGDRYAIYAESGGPDDGDRTDSERGLDDLERRSSEEVARSAPVNQPGQARGRVFADGTIFATDWESGTAIDDWHKS